ncbi:MAG: hypothetical protein E6503_21305 [Klebsiella michiganensis]|nr:hypothetical protein [Klebsiella michiganensis]
MQGRRYSVTCYQQTLDEQLISKWQGPPTTKKPAPAVFNNPNGELEMPNQHIAVCNIIRANKELSKADFSKFMDFAQMYWRQYQSECAQEA